jgi:hypothetical protein
MFAIYLYKNFSILKKRAEISESGEVRIVLQSDYLVILDQ